MIRFLAAVGRQIGMIAGGVVAAIYMLAGLASCVQVNPCSALLDDAEAQVESGDYEAAEVTLDDYVNAGCPVDDGR